MPQELKIQAMSKQLFLHNGKIRREDKTTYYL